MYVTKIFEFEASHHLPNYVGACHNLHGHSYKLEVTVGGSVQTEGEKSGMIIDFKDLKKIVKDEVIDRYDHSNLNDYFDNPTAELMVESIGYDIMKKLPREVFLVSCKLWETSTSYAEFSPYAQNIEKLLKYADNAVLRPAT